MTNEIKKSDLLKAISDLPKTPLNCDAANKMLNQATELWAADGFSGLEGTENSKFFQEFMKEHGKFPQLMLRYKGA